jgi:PAS domain S-box-containing protein
MIERLDEIRERLRGLPDPLSLLESIFAFAPVGFQIYRADGHCLLTNRAFRELFGSEPPPDYNVLKDEVAQATGVLELIHRAFKGETVTTPPSWYDPRELKHVKVSTGRRVAISAIFFPFFDSQHQVTHVAIVFKDVTAEIQAKEAAEARQREAEEQRNLRDAILQHSGDGIIVCDEQGVIRVFNPEAERQHGVAKREVMAPEWAVTYGLYTLDRQPMPLEQMPLYRAFRGEKVEGASWLVRRPTGEWRVLVGTSSPVFKPDGSPGGAVLITRDETERLRLEAGLRASEERYRFLAESMPQIVWTATPEGQLDYVNQVLARYIGKSVEAALGSGWHELIHPDDIAESTRRWSHSLKTCAPYEVEHRVRRADGVYRWFLVRGTPMRGPDGAVIKWFGTSTDIDDLKESEAQFRSMFDSGMLGIGFWNAAGEITRANDRLLGLVGYTREEFLAGKVNWKQLTPPEHLHLDEQSIRDLVSTGSMVPFEKEYIRKDGARIPVLVGGSLFPGETGRGAFFALDVSREVAARREIERLVRELNDAVRTRDDFLAVAGHEMRTPLTAAQLHLQGLQRAAEKDPASAPFAEKLRRAIATLKRLERLVAELLDVSQILGGRLHLHPEPLELVSFTASFVEGFKEAAAEAGCSIEFSATEPIHGEWDRSRLEQVLTNLLGNAFKFGARKPVTVRVRHQEGFAHLVMEDQGIGIAPEDQARLFQRFERAVSSRHFGGMGLGLWIVRQITEASGGSVTLSSQLGRGTTVTVRLPLRPPVAASAGPSEPG